MTSGYDYDPSWTLTQDKGTTIWFRQNGIASQPSYYYYIYTGKIPVTVGQRYCFSVYSGAHRAKIEVYGQFYDVNDGASPTPR